MYEHTLGEDIANYRVRAFPTYVVFNGGVEMGRVEGVNFEKVRMLVLEHCKSKFGGEGNSLGGSGDGALSAEEARAQRLARFGAAPAPAPAPAAPMEESKPESKDEVLEDVEAAPAEADGTAAMEEDEPQMVDPTENLDKECIETLTNSMGFSLIRAQKGLLNGNGTVEGAVDWLMQHQEDADIDDPIEKVPSSASGAVAQSYKCNECGKILSNMANLELHANKTGHSDFEESTEIKKPLTEEEKKAKVAEIKGLLKAKRMERENKEKEENVQREKQRRFMGQGECFCFTTVELLLFNYSFIVMSLSAVHHYSYPHCRNGQNTRTNGC